MNDGVNRELRTQNCDVISRDGVSLVGQLPVGVFLSSH